LIDAGVGFSYKTKQDLVSITEKLISDIEMRTSLDETARNFVQQRKGATDVIVRYIEENRLLSKS